jgi:hypothetical protein
MQFIIHNQNVKKSLSLSLLMIFLNLLMSPWALGVDLLGVLRTEHSYQKYYQIQRSKAGMISLLNWNYEEDQNYVLPEKYQRKRHFKGWIRDPSHATCFDVRNLTLQRQAQSLIITNPKNQCEIIQSKWYDPYSNQYLYRASDVDIDHIVPLKNAYYAGAWEWNQARRCNYSNFMADPYHLLAVENTENRSKGDNGPDKFLPVNIQFQCLYISIWLRIKAFWNLKIALEEADAIQTFLSQHSCPAEFFKVRSEEFTRIQRQTQSPPLECTK